VVQSGKVRYIGASSLWAWEFCKALYLQKLIEPRGVVGFRGILDA
jgi:aryl-alcohol dehydrogenase-like predicted oxidoreductase